MKDHNILIRRLGQFVRSEAQAQRFELEKTLALPLAERVAKSPPVRG